MKSQYDHITILKASGKREPFSVNKLRGSLLRSGASLDDVEQIENKVMEDFYDGISTAEIYRKAFNLLKQKRKGHAAKYKLKNSIMELGPTGFPFEKFIARLFQRMGYVAETGKILFGQCVDHEVDVVAYKEDEQLLMECKFHQQKGTVCDVKIPLYISARFKDIKEKMDASSTNEKEYFDGWLITNTHFTKDAMAFGLCSGLKLMSWDFPENKSLKFLIDRYGLHPVTSLTTLTKYEKQQLLEKGIVLCSDLADNQAMLKYLIHLDRVVKVNEECSHLIRHESVSAKRKREMVQK